MKRTMITLGNAEDIRRFVETVSRYEFDVELATDAYNTVDAKSIMGIFGLDLTKPIEVRVDAEDCEEFLQELKVFQA